MNYFDQCGGKRHLCVFSSSAQLLLDLNNARLLGVIKRESFSPNPSILSPTTTHIHYIHTLYVL